jgi:prohibitin 1
MNEEEKTLVTKIKLIALLVLLGFGFITLLSGVQTIDAGEVGVVTKFGAVTGRVLEPGAHIIIPFVEGVKVVNTKFLLYETMKAEDQKLSKSNYTDVQVDTNTKDGQRVDVFYTLRFSIDAKTATSVIQNFGSESILVDNIVRAESRSKARIIPSDFSAEDLYLGSGKQKVADDLFKSLQGKFEANGIHLDSVLVREIGFTDQYVQAIEQKQIEAVKVETAKNIALRAEEEKKTAITQAEAQSKSQDLQRLTISSELLQKMLIEKWDGHYPSYLITGGGASNFILPLPNK